MNRISFLMMKSVFLFCILVIPMSAQKIVISHDVNNASGWFGGDNRDSTRVRSVGIAQSVVFDTSMVVENFSFYFSRKFDFRNNPENTGHVVTLRFHIRDANGNILKTISKVVPASYSGGWITFDSLNQVVQKGSMLIFSCYLEGALDTAQYTSSYLADQNAGFAAGTHYVKIITDTAENFEDWNGWKIHSWDAMFRLEGNAVATAIVDTPTPVIEQLHLYPSYPNPFNPGTTVRFRLPQPALVSVEVFDAWGQRVSLLYQGVLPAGEHRFRWNGTNMEGDAVATGVYVVRVMAGGTIQSQKIQLIR